jgi:hypothetical protein
MHSLFHIVLKVLQQNFNCNITEFFVSMLINVCLVGRDTDSICVRRLRQNKDAMKCISSHYSCRTSFEIRFVFLPPLVFGVVAQSVKTIVITPN